MPNILTGDYEAAVQIATRQVDGLLGTLHQNAAIPDATPTLLTRVTLRIGDPPRRRADIGAFANWLLEYQRSSGRGFRDVRAELIATAPPGAASMLTEALVAFDDNPVVELPPEAVRGTAKVQVSSVRVSVPTGSSFRAVVQARVRAHYYPDAGTTDLPAPVHGDVRIAFDVRQVPSGFGTRLQIGPSSQDSDIEFIPVAGSGLNALQTSVITAEIRKFVRQGLTMVPVDLPSDFSFAGFKGVGSEAGQVIALPFQLSGAASPAGGLQGLGQQSFIGSSGFAIAVAKEYVTTLIDTEAIRQTIRNRPVRVPYIGVTYRLRFSSGPTLTFKHSGMEISGRIEGETSTRWAPNWWISFKQLIAVVLDPSTQTVRLERAGEPEINKSWELWLVTAGNIVRSEIDNALAANTPSVQRVFDDGKNALVRSLRTFDQSAVVSYAAVEVTADAVIVHGDIGGGPRRAAVVDVAETHQGTAFTAFRS